MAHMKPKYSDGPFYIVDRADGNYAVPVDAFHDVYPQPQWGYARAAGTGHIRSVFAQTEDGAEYDVQYIPKGEWFCCLEAPGYLDCTEWSGPFETLVEARDFIVKHYEVHPDTGEAFSS